MSKFVIKKRFVTEKAHKQSESGVYTFGVELDARKNDVKECIEKAYSVKVQSVNITNIPGKKKNFRNTRGFKSGYKKAFVTLKPGMKIDFGS